jgi:hypothetical protein
MRFGPPGSWLRDRPIKCRLRHRRRFGESGGAAWCIDDEARDPSELDGARVPRLTNALLIASAARALLVGFTVTIVAAPG